MNQPKISSLLLLFFIIVFSGLLISCDKIIDDFIDLATCKNEIQLPDLELSEEAINFIDYQSEDTLTFQNDFGDTIMLYDGRTHFSKNRQNLGQCQFLNATFKSGRITSNKDTVHTGYRIRFVTEVRLDSDNMPIEQTAINLKIDDKSNALSLSINHENAPDLTEITLLGRSFKNVYVNQKETIGVSYFNKEKGVVAFIDFDSTLWVLID